MISYHYVYFYQYRILTRAFTSVEKFYHWSNWEDCIYCRIFDCSWHPELIVLCSYWIAIYIVFFFLFFTAVLLISENIYFTLLHTVSKLKRKISHFYYPLCKKTVRQEAICTNICYNMLAKSPRIQISK